MLRFALAFIVFLCPLITRSQVKPAKAPLPAWLESITYSEELKDTTNTGSTYYLLLEKQVNIDQSQTFYREAIKVLSEPGLEYASSIDVNFDPAFQKLVFHAVTIKRGNKVFDRLDISRFEVLRREENMDRLVYDKSLNAILNLDDVQVGDIVEYSYSVKGTNPLFKGHFSRSFYFEYSVPVGRIYTRIQCSKDKQLVFKPFQDAVQPSRSDKGSTSSYVWDTANVPALLSDGETPAWFNDYDNVEVSDYSSWENVSKWVLPLFSDKFNSNEIDNKVNEIKNAHTSVNDQVNAVIEFVQDEIRYLSFSDGIQGYKPHPPNQIFKQRFGDCKDKSLLLSYMIRQLGVECYPALVSTTAGKVIDQSLPSPTLFDHCIAQLRFNDSTFWIDATRTLERGSLRTKSSVDYGYALVITENTKDLTAIEFNSKEATVRVHEEYAFKIVGGPATLKVKTIYSGSEASSMRRYMKSTSAERIKKSYTDFYAKDFAEVGLNGLVEFQDNVRDNILTTFEDYTIGEFWKYDSATGVSKAEFNARVIGDYLNAPKSKNRKRPYGITFPADVKHTITITLPQAWNVPESKSQYQTSSFKYTSEVDYVGDKIILSHTYRSLKDHVPAAEIKDYITKIDKAYNDLFFELTSGGVPAASKTPTFNAPYAAIAMVMLPLLFVFGRKIHRFDPRASDYKISYDGIGGFLFLPLIGLILSPIGIIIILSGYFDYSKWQTLADKSYSGYNLSWGALNLFVFLYYLVRLGISILLIVLFFERRTSFPMIMIILLAGSALIHIVEVVWYQILLVDGPNDRLKTAIMQSISAAIWIPVFIYSDRVKGTFTQRLN